MKKPKRAKPKGVSSYDRRLEPDTFNVAASLLGGIEIAAACSAHLHALPKEWSRVEESIFHGKNRSCDFCRMDGGETPARRMQLKDNHLYPKEI